MGEREPSRHTAYIEVLDACRKGEGYPERDSWVRASGMVAGKRGIR